MLYPHGWWNQWTPQLASTRQAQNQGGHRGHHRLREASRTSEKTFWESVWLGEMWVWVNTYRYIFSGMNIHLPAILGFTRYQGFDPSPCQTMGSSKVGPLEESSENIGERLTTLIVGISLTWEVQAMVKMFYQFFRTDEILDDDGFTGLPCGWF